MNIKVKVFVRRVAKGKLKKARVYAAFRVSQSPVFFIEREDITAESIAGIAHQYANPERIPLVNTFFYIVDVPDLIKTCFPRKANP